MIRHLDFNMEDPSNYFGIDSRGFKWYGKRETFIECWRGYSLSKPVQYYYKMENEGLYITKWISSEYRPDKLPWMQGYQWNKIEVIPTEKLINWLDTLDVWRAGHFELPMFNYMLHASRIISTHKDSFSYKFKRKKIIL
jgi:hypothetical protein